MPFPERERQRRRSLRAVFDPRSVAIVGASDDPRKWGHHLATSVLGDKERRPVYLVNRSSRPILGQPTFPNLSALPETPELVAVAVPALAFESVVNEALAAGTRVLVGITAGLGEKNSAAADRERQIVERVRQAGAMLVGPNCAGINDCSSAFHLEWERRQPGTVGLISQSGNLATELTELASASGLGISRFVSIGNQADLELADFVYDFAEHEKTRVIACYVEDFRDGREFVRAARHAVSAGKPVIVLAAGRTAAGTRAARSHTGALASDIAAVRAACRSAGAELVTTPGALIDLAQLRNALLMPAGQRIAVFGDGGGACAVAADTLTEAGLNLPAFSDGLSRRLEQELPPTASTGNPIDLSGSGENDLGVYARVLSLVLDSEEVDAALLTGYFGGYSAYGDAIRSEETGVAESLASVARRAKRPLVVHTIFPASPVVEILRRGGVPVYNRIEMAVRALAALAERRPYLCQATIPRLVQEQAVPDVLDVSYFGARALVAATGVPTVRAIQAHSVAEVLTAAAKIGYPVVLKALGRLHKSDDAGVVVDIADEARLVSEYTDMTRRLTPAAFSVEELAPISKGLELIVGVRRDHRFGPILLVGFGGIYSEVFADVAVALAPASPEEISQQLLGLRAAPLLIGARGRPPLDVDAAARAASALSLLAAARPDIAEIEVNPLLALPIGVVALDARVVPATTKTTKTDSASGTAEIVCTDRCRSGPLS